MDYFDAKSRERDLPFRSDGDQLVLLAERRAAVACLRDAAERCEFEDMRTERVLAALGFLEVGLSGQGDRAARRFRQGLGIPHPRERVEVLRHCLRSIELACDF